MLDLNVSSIRGWIVCLKRHLRDCCGSTVKCNTWEGKEIFGIWKPLKFNVPGWNERAKELNAQYREAVSHWHIAGRPRSGPFSELKCRARAVFWHEIKLLRDNEDQLRSQSMLSKVQMGKCNDFWKVIKAVNGKMKSQPLTVGGTCGESNIANLWKDHFSAMQILLAPLITEIRSWMHWGLSQAIMMLLMYMNCGKLWKDWKIRRLLDVGNDGITSEVYKFASDRLLPMMSIFLSGCMITGKLPSTIMHVVIIPLLKCKSKDPSDVNNYRPICNCHSSLQGTWAGLAVATRQVPVNCRQQFGFKQAHRTEMAIFALKQTVDFYHNQDTVVCMCFLDAKKDNWYRVNHWTLGKKLFHGHKCAIAYCEIVYLLV